MCRWRITVERGYHREQRDDGPHAEAPLGQRKYLSFPGITTFPLETKRADDLPAQEQGQEATEGHQAEGVPCT